MMTVSNTRNPCHCETVEESDPTSYFDCSICLDTPQDPVVTKCGHLFCWPCLHQWITIHPLSEECPVCKACVKDSIIPLYGRGKVGLTILDSNIPQRPSAQRSYVAAASMPLAAGFEHHQSHGNRRGHSSCSAAAFSIFPALFGYRIIPLPEYSSGFSSGAAYNGLPAMTSERRRLSAKQEFVLYWFLILLVCFTSLCFLLF